MKGGFKLEASILAEMSLVGCVIIDSKLIDNVVSCGITVDCFEVEPIRNIYKAMMNIASQGGNINFVSLLTNLASSGFDDKEYKKIMFNCVNSVPAKSQIDYYAKTVYGNYKARQLKEFLNEVDGNTLCAENVKDVAFDLSEKIYGIMYDKNQGKLVDIYSVGVDVSDSFKHKDDVSYDASTGFEKVDSVLKGLSPGNLIILAARPKVGKTAFALAIAKNVALSGKTVALFSLEMTKYEIYERLLSCSETISLNRIIDKNFSKSDMEKVDKFLENVKSLPIKINDNANISVAEMKCQCKVIDNLGLVIVDYLQLIKPNGKYDNRNQEVGAISRELKLLACELGVPVLCLAQLNRANSDDKRPLPNDLRDSGEIEQNCNKLMLMWCVEKHLSEIGMVSSKTIGCDVALNRRGNTGVVLMDFNGEFMCFREIDKKYEEKKVSNSWK